jgi:hypothetical protein
MIKIVLFTLLPSAKDDALLREYSEYVGIESDFLVEFRLLCLRVRFFFIDSSGLEPFFLSNKLLEGISAEIMGELPGKFLFFRIFDSTGIGGFETYSVGLSGPKIDCFIGTKGSAAFFIEDDNINPFSGGSFVDNRRTLRFLNTGSEGFVIEYSKT